jgi:hypothetical protein
VFPSSNIFRNNELHETWWVKKVNKGHESVILPLSCASEVANMGFQVGQEQHQSIADQILGRQILGNVEPKLLALCSIKGTKGKVSEAGCYRSSVEFF